MDMLYSDEYKEISIQNHYNIIKLLLDRGVEFSIITHTNVIEFNPEIPESIIKFGELARFDIFGYSYESSTLTNSSLSFEAGFGQSNFGSVLTVPLEAIYHIVSDEITLSLSYYKPKLKREPNSMNILLNNPENQKLIKKNKKVK